MAKETGDREQEILEAAIKVISDKGFDGSTTSEIAKTAGVAEGTIFRYFKTKNDILHKIILKLMDTVSSSLIVAPVAKIIEENKDKDERELLFLILKDRLKLIDKNLPLIKIVFSELMIRKDLREAWGEKVVSRVKDVVGSYIEQKIWEGKFREVDTFTAMRSLIGMTFLYIAQRHLLPGVTELQDEDAELMRIVDLFINGIKK